MEYHLWTLGNFNHHMTIELLQSNLQHIIWIYSIVTIVYIAVRWLGFNLSLVVEGGLDQHCK